MLLLGSSRKAGRVGKHSELPLPILWNQTSDVHGGSTLIM